MKDKTINYNIRNKASIITALVGLVTLMTVIAGLSGLEVVLYAAENFYYGWKAPPEYRDLKNPLLSTEQSVTQGKKLYQIRCLACHGAKGAGLGSSTDSLQTFPGDLSDERRMKLYTDGTLFWKISVGRGEMPPWRIVLSSIGTCKKLP